MLMTNNRIDINGIFTKYLKRELSEKEQHNFERLVMSDPFYADAFDGLSNISPEELDRDLKILDKQLSLKISKTDKRVWFASAASILVLVGLVSWLAFWMPNINKQEIAKSDAIIENNRFNKPEHEMVAPISEEQNTQLEAEEKVRIAEVKSIVMVEEDSEILFTAPQIVSSDEIIEYEASYELSKEIIRAETVENADLLVTAIVEDSMSPNMLAESEPITSALSGRAAGVSVSSKSKKNNDIKVSDLSSERYISADNYVIVNGYVLDESEEPLVGVYVSQKNSTNGTITDLNGHFKIKIPKNEADNTILTTSFIGYESKQFSTSNENYVIMLNPSLLAMEEVVVTGYGVKTNEDAADAGFKSAYPSIGMDEYKNEVISRLKELNITDSKAYNLVVKITVLSTGIISDVEIVKSPINERYNAQVKKVIKETSSWLPAKRDGDLIDSDVRITFKVK